MTKRKKTTAASGIKSKGSKASEKTAFQLRQDNQERYDKWNVEPTTLEDGTVVRSRLEALWVAELEVCDSFRCVECVKVPLWIEGPYGKILGNYKPDILIELNNGNRIFVELKPTADLALADDRAKRALELNPKYKFVIIGGYPYNKRLTVRLLTGENEKTYPNMKVCDILKFF